MLVVLFTAIQTLALAYLAAALRRGEASRLAPWQYTGLVWAMVLDAVMFGVSPILASFLGGLMIVAGGIVAQLGLRSVDRGGHQTSPSRSVAKRPGGNVCKAVPTNVTGGHGSEPWLSLDTVA